MGRAPQLLVQLQPFLLLPVLFHSNQRPVISTEAAHSLTVSSAVEKSASLPPLLLDPHKPLHVL
jgi:hypothetical protein